MMKHRNTAIYPRCHDCKNTFANQSSVRTWLTGILKNKLIDNFRRRKREVVMGDLVDQSEADQLEDFFRTNGSWIDKPTAFPNPDSALQQKYFGKYFSSAYQG